MLGTDDIYRQHYFVFNTPYILLCELPYTDYIATTKFEHCQALDKWSVTNSPLLSC